MQAHLTAKTPNKARGGDGTSETGIRGEKRGGTTGGWEKHQKLCVQHRVLPYSPDFVLVSSHTTL